jgi:uncharacterized protein YcfL
MKKIIMIIGLVLTMVSCTAPEESNCNVTKITVTEYIPQSGPATTIGFHQKYTTSVELTNVSCNLENSSKTETCGLTCGYSITTITYIYH